MPPVPENVVRVQLVHEVSDGPEIVTNTFHLHRFHRVGNTVEWTGDVQEIANKIVDKYTVLGSAFDHVSNIAKLVRVKTYHLNAATGLAMTEGEATNLPVGGLAGRRTGIPLPGDVAVVISMRTEQTGEVLPDPETGPSPLKRSRGRVFIGPISSDYLHTNGRLAIARRDAIADSWAAFINDVEGMTVGGGTVPDYMRFVVLSRVGSAVRRVNEIVVDDLFDTQRRRTNRQIPSRARRTIALENQ